MSLSCGCLCFFFKQKTAYDLRISDWSSDVCSSDLLGFRVEEAVTAVEALNKVRLADGRIDAALIDVGLPDRRGDSLAAELRAMYSQMPIVIASEIGRAHV